MPEFTFRPITSADEPVLRAIYYSTRAAEMAMVPWSDAEKESFLAMQFDAQHRYYQEQFGNASFDLILLDGELIGRLYLDRRENALHIIDIALLPAWRGQGNGGRLLADILDEAAAAKLPVTIYVEENNPAQRLYRRLGFEPVKHSGLYWLMRAEPGQRQDHAG